MPLKRNHPILSNRYEILQDLGEGGLGRVYKVCDRWNGKDVALKVLTPGPGDLPLEQGFQKEFLLLRQLTHPGVVQALDFGYAESNVRPGKPLPYFTMELVEGRSLKESLVGFSSTFSLEHATATPRSGANPPDGQTQPHATLAEYGELSHLLWQICDILEFLHLRGLVHCDLKPDNLKVTDRIFRPVILDFGLSEQIGSRRQGETKGTLPYMAPEMFKPEPLDERTDLYSLGVILYELVTSKLPFCFEDPVKIISAHLEQKPQPPSELNPGVPAWMDRLIIKLLEKSPKDRPSSAREVKKMIETGGDRNSRQTTKPQFSERQTLLCHLHSGPMVGRQTELSRLEKRLKLAISSQGTCFFLHGEQGVGKTFLLQHLGIQCQFKGMVFVDSSCLESQTVAYQPLMEILQKLEPYVKDRCPDHLPPAMKKVFDRSEDDSSGSLETQEASHQRLCELLRQISRVFPLVLVIENLQWADSLTLKFLNRFAEQKDKGRVFLCCSLRQEKSKRNTPSQHLIELLSRNQEDECLNLRRFDLSGTKELILSKFVRQRLSVEFFTFVHQRTSGNPFFIMELLRYLVENDLVVLKDSTWTSDGETLDVAAVPDSIETILMRNLERYDPKTLHFLNVAAVVGKKFAFRLLTGLGIFDERTLSEILSTLTNDQVLTRKQDSAKGRTYHEFANQSLQSLLYQRLDQATRVLWHSKIGELLERMDSKDDEESVFEMAHHYLEAGVLDKAYQYALASAERMQQRFANPEVLRYLEQAISIASGFSNEQEAAEKLTAALMKRADFCKKVGELREAEKDYRAILKLIQDSSDLKMLAKTYNDLGETYRLQHDYRKGISCLKRAMRLHRKLDAPLELANTLSYMGLLYWTDSQYQNALASFQKALKIDRSLGNKSSEASTLNNMGLVYWSQHQYSQALEYFTDALSVYRELDNKEWIGRCLNNIGSTLFESGEYLKCIDYYL
ncbi:MAG: tetratricopeptide repeat protein [Candidatus Zixiibacteriota bacterium]